MKNIDFLKDVLMSDAEYWIVKSGKYIMLIAIPNSIPRNLKYEEITLQELEKINRLYCDYNIIINNDTPPFQQFMSFCNITVGFPINKGIKKFMLDALALKSDNIYEYKNLIVE